VFKHCLPRRSSRSDPDATDATVKRGSCAAKGEVKSALGIIGSVEIACLDRCTEVVHHSLYDRREFLRGAAV
jgi:hypothetical protein